MQRPTRDYGEVEFEDLEPGTYVCTLKIKDCLKKKWNSDETVQGYRFSFKVDGKNAYINSFPVTATTSKRGALFGMMQQCHDSLLKEVRFSDRGFALDEDKFFELLQACESKMYEVTCSNHEAHGQTYLKLEEFKPLPGACKGGTKAQDVIPQAAEEDDSDIPF